MAQVHPKSHESGSSYRKDYIGGMLMLLIGASAVYISSSYGLGTLNNIGPGFFPSMVGWVLIVLGPIITLTARTHDDNDNKWPMLPDVRGAIAILASLVAFIAVGEYGGLLPATFTLVFIAAMGDRQNSVVESLLLAAGMCAIAVVVFSWALKMQFPLFTWG